LGEGDGVEIGVYEPPSIVVLSDGPYHIEPRHSVSRSGENGRCRSRHVVAGAGFAVGLYCEGNDGQKMKLIKSTQDSNFVLKSCYERTCNC
jgi:hypothetical protein